MPINEVMWFIFGKEPTFRAFFRQNFKLKYTPPLFGVASTLAL